MNARAMFLLAVSKTELEELRLQLENLVGMVQEGQNLIWRFCGSDLKDVAK